MASSHEWSGVPLRDVFIRLSRRCSKPVDVFFPLSFARFGRTDLRAFEPLLTRLLGAPANGLVDESEERITYLGRVTGNIVACQQEAVCPKKAAAVADCVKAGRDCSKEFAEAESCVQAFFDNVRAIPQVKKYEQRIAQVHKCQRETSKRAMLAGVRTLQGLEPEETVSKAISEREDCVYAGEPSFPQLAACKKAHPNDYKEACKSQLEKVDAEFEGNRTDAAAALGFKGPQDFQPDREWYNELVAEAQALGYPPHAAKAASTTTYEKWFQAQLLSHLANRALVDKIKKKAQEDKKQMA